VRLNKLDPVWYRLLRTPPFQVATRDCVYTFQIQCRLPSGDGQWELAATCPGGLVIISEFFRRREDLENALIDSFCTRHLTAAEGLMERLVRLGWAARMAQPETLPPLGMGQPWNA
jgi:hypothetical protein